MEHHSVEASALYGGQVSSMTLDDIAENLGLILRLPS